MGGGASGDLAGLGGGTSRLGLWRGGLPRRRTAETEANFQTQEKRRSRQAERTSLVIRKVDLQGLDVSGDGEEGGEKGSGEKISISTPQNENIRTTPAERAGVRHVVALPDQRKMRNLGKTPWKSSCCLKRRKVGRGKEGDRHC